MKKRKHLFDNITIILGGTLFVIALLMITDMWGRHLPRVACYDEVDQETRQPLNHGAIRWFDNPKAIRINGNTIFVEVEDQDGNRATCTGISMLSW